jgi:large subunit ribosomal protein L25
MKSIAISGEIRTNHGKKEAKSLRREGKVPCVLYGADNNAIPFSAEAKSFKDLVYTPDFNAASINLNGKEYKAIIQDIQFHPVNDSILHIDFIQLVDKKPVKALVPVKLVGTAAGVKAGGKLVKTTRLLKVKAEPAYLPATIEINVENLEVGSNFRVKDLQLNNVSVLEAANKVIATVKGKRGMAEQAAPAAAPAASAAPAKK